MLESTIRSGILEVLSTLEREVEVTCDKASLWKETRAATHKDRKQLYELIDAAVELIPTLKSSFNSLKDRLVPLFGGDEGDLPPESEELAVWQAIKDLGLPKPIAATLIYMHSDSIRLLQIEPSVLLPTLGTIDDFRFISDAEALADEKHQDASAVFFHKHLLQTVAQIYETKETLTADGVTEEVLRESLKPVFTELLALLTMSFKLRYVTPTDSD